MPIFRKWTLVKDELNTADYPNYWDLIAVLLVFGIIVLLAWAAKGMTAPYHLGQSLPISVDPSHLPYYAFRSVLRMILAFLLSLFFTFIVGAAAAKSRHAERLIIPLIDILQSVPVLGYLSISVVAFIAIFPNSLLGPELAAIFVIFTAQVWNMTLSFYQSLRTVPEDLKETAYIFQLSSWQRFWRLEVPFAMPGLVWNAMMSMSASWFFVVASEAISVNNQAINLPGIGSYIALAVKQANMTAVIYAIITMFIVILVYDQLVFRPLSDWIDKFKFEDLGEDDLHRSWIVRLFQRTNILRRGSQVLQNVAGYWINLPWGKRSYSEFSAKDSGHKLQKMAIILWYSLLCLALGSCLVMLSRFVLNTVTWQEILHVVWLGFITAMKVIVLIILTSIIWIPISVWIGLRRNVAYIAQPIVQFLASFPVNLFYPIAVIVIIKFHLNPNIWTAPLMVLGSQWYIVFNVIAGTTAIPKDLRQVATSFAVDKGLWWRRLILPAIFPYYITGAITAAGGAWNASIIAEVVSWGNTSIVATGLGAYITQQAHIGDFARLALGVAIMCLYVATIDRIFWRPLYRLVAERFRLG